MSKQSASSDADTDAEAPDLTLFVQTYVAEFPIGDLIPYPGNARSGDVGAIAESMTANSAYGALIVQESTKHILVGNHRYLAARLLGATTVPVFLLDVDDATARRINLFDNLASDRATYNTEMLVEELQTVIAESGTLDGTGYDGDDLDDLIASLTEPEPEPEPPEPKPLSGNQRSGPPDRRVADLGIEMRGA